MSEGNNPPADLNAENVTMNIENKPAPPEPPECNYPFYSFNKSS